MELNTPQLQLVIMAVRDALRLGKEELDRMSEDEQVYQEDYLMQLGNLDGELRREYEKRRKSGEQILSYEVLVGERKFRKL